MPGSSWGAGLSGRPIEQGTRFAALEWAGSFDRRAGAHPGTPAPSSSQVMTRGDDMSTYSSAASSSRANPTVRAALESDRESLGHGENVGEMERWISGAVGTALVVNGLRRP